MTTRDLEAENARLTKAIRDTLWECPQIAVVGVNFQDREHGRTKAVECIANAARNALSPPYSKSVFKAMFDDTYPSASEQSALPADGFVEDATDVAIEAFDDAYDAEYKLSGCVDNKRTAMKVAVQAVIAMCAAVALSPPSASQQRATVAGSPDAWRG